MNKVGILLTLTLGICISASAQNCKMLKEDKDSFSGETEEKAHLVLGKGAIRWSVDFNHNNKESSMKLGIAMRGEFNQKIGEGTKMLLKMGDESILTLTTSEASSPVTQAAANGVAVNIYSVYYLKFNLDKDALEKLSKSAIMDFKIDIEGQKIQNPKFTDSQMEKMQDIFICLLQRK